ncbi:MAG: tRNA pseudouridine(55) synthase TruB [Alphaproteobacteria bacterium]|nr:tRNA pseudouridine(55) synthase TruB [Alphaproteobacteria bacterium]HCQ70970.1 tRNA pseudouridine(55) synthase TruB [Rhodospirillaceae bacterium]|tara:strand:+ start:15483 stop:16415 length:933 start_codon:yes stop_codon:yes gene_type:complete
MGRKRKGNPVNGWINLDKPLGLTSTQAIGKLRRLYSPQKIGHAGTLDPLATGILPIAMGEATKTIPFIQDAIKTYEFTVTWGQQRSTDDAEGDVIASSDVRPTSEQITNALPAFLGEIEQTPPQFSAIKINGQRAYDLARAGQDVEIKSRKVFIESLDVLDTQTDHATLRMICGKGTYVRSLARDLALSLGTCGYVSMLRRTAVGCFSEKDAISLAILEEMHDSAALGDALLPIESALDDILALPITQQEKALLKNGRALSFVSKTDFHRLDGLDQGTEILATFDNKPVALVILDKAQIKPVRVFNIDNQ